MKRGKKGVKIWHHFLEQKMQNTRSDPVVSDTFKRKLTLFFPLFISEGQKAQPWFGSSEDTRAQPSPRFRALNPAIYIELVI
jgi:hypothetical protein